MLHLLPDVSPNAIPTEWIPFVNLGSVGLFVYLLFTGKLFTKGEVDRLVADKLADKTQLQADLKEERAYSRSLELTFRTDFFPKAMDLARVASEATAELAARRRRT